MGKIYPGFLKHSTVNEDPTAAATALWTLPLIFNKSRGPIFFLYPGTDLVLQGE